MGRIRRAEFLRHDLRTATHAVPIVFVLSPSGCATLGCRNLLATYHYRFGLLALELGNALVALGESLNEGRVRRVGLFLLRFARI